MDAEISIDVQDYICVCLCIHACPCVYVPDLKHTRTKYIFHLSTDATGAMSATLPLSGLFLSVMYILESSLVTMVYLGNRLSGSEETKVFLAVHGTCIFNHKQRYQTTGW